MKHAQVPSKRFAMTVDEILTDDEMKRCYGSFYAASPKVSIDLSRVPQGLHALAPYAEFWGIADDCEREALVAKSPREVQENLKRVIASFDDDLDDWLAGDDADNPTPSREYVVFSAMRMAADFV